MTPQALSFLFSNKRFWLFVLSSVAAVVLGFFAIPGVMAIVFVSDPSHMFVSY